VSARRDKDPTLALGVNAFNRIYHVCLYLTQAAREQIGSNVEETYKKRISGSVGVWGCGGVGVRWYGCVGVSVEKKMVYFIMLLCTRHQA
jgi:hypothetical protein